MLVYEHNISASSPAQVLFVQPQEKVSHFEDRVGSRFIEDLKRFFTSFVIVTLADSVGEVEDSSSLLSSKGAELASTISKYQPKSIVALGPLMSKFLIPSLNRWEIYEITWSIHTLTLRGQEYPVHCFPTYRAIYARLDDYLLLRENLTKVQFLSDKPYYKKGSEILLTSYKDASEYLRFLRYDHAGSVGLDTETANLNYAHHTQLASIQFAHDAYNGYVLLRQHDENPFSPEENAKLDDQVRDLLDSQESRITYWILHNAQFDNAQFYSKYRVLPRKPIIDTMLALHLLDSARKARVYTMRGHKPLELKQLVLEFLGFHHYDAEMLEARKDGTLLGLPLPKFVSYSGMDPYVAVRGFDALLAQAKSLNYEEKFLAMLLTSDSRKVKAYSTMTHFGMMADVRHLVSLGSPSSPLLKRLRDIKGELQKDKVCQAVNRELLHNSVGVTTTFTVPWVLDLNSQDHRTRLFFTSENGFKYPANEEGKYSADSDFQDEYRDTNPIVALFGEFQGLQKLDSSYIRKFNTNFANPGRTDFVDGRIHGKFLLHGTETGRLSSVEPNMQQIPRGDNAEKKAIKNIFVAPPGKVILQADFAAAEVRMWAEMSRDPGMVQNFIDAYRMQCAFRQDPTDLELRAKAHSMADIHEQNARLMFGIPQGQKVEKTLRTATKSITFGLMYARGIPSIAAQIGKSEKETEELCHSFYQRFAAGKAWLDGQGEFAREHGYVQTFFGRRRWLRDVFSDNRSLVARDLRKAVNSPIQSATGDYASLATALLFEELYNQGVHEVYKLVNAVHDSVLIEVPATVEDIKYAAQLTRYIFVTKTPQVIAEQFGHQMIVPLDIDMEVSQGKQWVCPKCGSTYQYSDHPKACSKTKKVKDADGTEHIVSACDSTEFVEKKLGHGWSTCIGMDESEPDFYAVAEGF